MLKNFKDCTPVYSEAGIRPGVVKEVIWAVVKKD
jgi:hypothetical protein